MDEAGVVAARAVVEGVGERGQLHSAVNVREAIKNKTVGGGKKGSFFLKKEKERKEKGNVRKMKFTCRP